MTDANNRAAEIARMDEDELAEVWWVHFHRGIGDSATRWAVVLRARALGLTWLNLARRAYTAGLISNSEWREYR